MEPTYPRAVLTSVLQGVFTGVWVAAGELPAPQRRPARAGSVLTLSALASIGDRGDAGEPVRERNGVDLLRRHVARPARQGVRAAPAALTEDFDLNPG